MHRWPISTLVLAVACPSAPEDADRAAEPAGAVDPVPAQPTFSEHVAPIIFEHCAPCHRPGEAAPFPLLSHEDVAEHATQIVEVTRSRFMPPWLPAPGDRSFVGERRLGDRELEILARWAESGAPAGDPSRTPPLPTFPTGWQLGEPDLVLELPAEYVLAADGRDVYRNFVLPIRVEQTTFVRAVELRPANPRIVHHAVMRVDTTEASRRADARDPAPGFDGMVFAGAHMPGGHFLGWTPGRTVHPGSDDESWALEPGTDLVLQMHLRPSGKPEPVGARVGLHFAAHPPTRPWLALLLSSRNIDIPPGVADYRTTDEYVLPVDVDLVSVYPHAHYLGRRLEAHVTLPDGSRQWLIRIPRWSFDWQDQYRYREPMRLPAGTKISMNFSHDNSAENPFNPADPPVRVQFGPQSTDEMSELILEVTPADPADLPALDRHYAEKFRQMDVEWYEGRLARDPNDVEATIGLAMTLQDAGQHERATALLSAAVEHRRDDPDLHVAMGISLAALGHHEAALLAAERALAADPDHVQALNNAGNAARELGRIALAIRHLEHAVAVDPASASAHNNLGIALKQRGELAPAIPHLERATRLDPRNALFWSNLGNARRSAGRDRAAAEAYERALALRPGWPTPLNHLAWILATSRDDTLRDPARAAALAEQVVQATRGRNPDGFDSLGAALAAAGRFDRALEALERGLELARQAELDHLVQGMERRREAYRRSEAWREP
jgi:Tfp pilus assembly protein PilF